MEPEEITEDLELEEQDETGEEEETPVEEPIQAPAKLTYEQKLANAKTDAEKFAIADAEAAKNRRLLGKSKKGPTAVEPRSETPSPTVDVDERILKSQGMPDELLTKLKAVAALEGVSLLDAQNNELFVAAKEKFERDQRTKKANVPPSRGSGSVTVKKTINTPNLTREEHRNLVKGR